MNTRTSSQSDTTAPAMPPRVRGLWLEAVNWVGWLLAMFDRDALRRKGVSRETGALLGIWLTNIEGAVRRLILAAAFAFPLAGYLRQPGGDARSRIAAPSSRGAGFCVFRLRGMGDATTPRPAHIGNTTPREPKPYGHIRFPIDPLLKLGATPRAHRERATTPRARNPLDRWGRLSRQDPDWRPPEQVVQFSRERTPHAAQPKSPPTRHASRPPEALQAGLPASLYDWRRRHDEWQKFVPAPDFAARFDALQRVATDPSAAIARAARRLAHSHNRALMLAREAAPQTEPPRRAAHIATAGHIETFIRTCHGALFTPDTS